MGIIIYLFLILSIIISIIDLIFNIFLILKKGFNFKELVLGFILAIVIYLILYIYFVTVESVYVFSGYFMFPLFMILLPFVFSVLFSILNLKFKFSVSIILNYSIMFSSIFILKFQNYSIGIVNFLSLNKYY
jgi:hypothetical protein